MNDVIKKILFSKLNIDDPFFDSLKNDYYGFKDWFAKKCTSNEEVYVIMNSGIIGFLYIKEECEEEQDITPPLIFKNRLKIGTFKIEAHGTILGERFLSIVFNKMMSMKIKEVYVTLFSKQTNLINLFEKFGFVKWGEKNTGELVYLKNILDKNDAFQNFPLIKTKNVNKYLLAIFPIYHTKLFPDSRLSTEKEHTIEDLSFTNTLTKVYLSAINDIQKIKKGDIIIIYRTAEENKSAEYSSVATSICTVVDHCNINHFNYIDEFLKYCEKGTIFTKDELNNFWHTKKYPYIIKLLYNIPLNKRINRHQLINDIGIDRSNYFGFVKIDDIQFNNILKLGEIDENFIIN